MGNIAFTAGTMPATCECHKGQTAVIVYLVSPNPEIPNFELAQIMFESEQEADKHISEVTKRIAQDFCESFGLSVDISKPIVSITDASKISGELKRFRSENGPTVH